MAQLFSAMFFGLMCAVAFAMVVAMLRAEWARVAMILSGRQLADARIPPQIRVRVRSWNRPEQRRAPSLRAAA